MFESDGYQFLFNHVEFNVSQNLEHFYKGWLCQLIQHNVSHMSLKILVEDANQNLIA
jgi:hypothetical protein